MIVTEKEIKRIVSLHFKNRYKMDINPKDMEWNMGHDSTEGYSWVDGLEIGGIIDGEDN
jgi:hypothetical protein